MFTQAQMAMSALFHKSRKRVTFSEPTSIFARTSQTWQKKEWFCLKFAFENLTGLRAEFPSSIAAFFFSEEAIDWLYQRCLNPYFFWSVIGEAAESASSFPISEEDIKAAGAKIAERHLRIYINRSASEEGCNVETLRNMRSACLQGQLSESSLESGLTAGILMLLSQGPNLIIGHHRPPGQKMDVIFNPVFRDMT